jgi:hypothetical protein
VNLERIRRRLSGGGFKPFAIRTSDGQQYSVMHPEWVLVAERSIAVMDSDGEIVTLDPLHIVVLKNLPQANGRASKR